MGSYCQMAARKDWQCYQKSLEFDHQEKIAYEKQQRWLILGWWSCPKAVHHSWEKQSQWLEILSQCWRIHKETVWQQSERRWIEEKYHISDAFFWWKKREGLFRGSPFVYLRDDWRMISIIVWKSYPWLLIRSDFIKKGLKSRESMKSNAIWKNRLFVSICAITFLSL